MSFVVALDAGRERKARAAEQKRRLRRRVAAVMGTLALVLGMAAIPLPVWKTSENLAGRGEQLRAWIDEARREDRQVAAFRAADGERTAREITARLVGWLRAHDPVETRNRLVGLARAAGLSVDDVQIVRDDEPLQRSLPAPRTATVLGAAVPAPAPAAAPDPPPIPLAADRITMSGSGPLPALLLFCGVLRELPEPLRLRSVRVDAAESGYRYRLQVEKLLHAMRDDGTLREIHDA